MKSSTSDIRTSLWLKPFLQEPQSSDPYSASEASAENIVPVPNLSEGKHGSNTLPYTRSLLMAGAALPSSTREGYTLGFLTGMPAAVYALPTTAK